MTWWAKRKWLTGSARGPRKWAYSVLAAGRFRGATVRYASVKPPQDALRRRLRELSEVRVAYGYRRLHVLLRREGRPVNAKRVYRLYKQEGLAMRKKVPRRRVSCVKREVLPTAARKNDR